jgi:phosphonate degradation associated HDIG domain protein
MDDADPIATIMHLFAVHGHAAYFGEGVSELEHALQAAHLAEASGARPELVVAALLHDIGHLLHGLPENIAERGIDGRHEQCGADWLARHFTPAVVAPVRLHVSAKRYLCAIDADYARSLSPASLRSLHLQGGTFDPVGVAAFEREPHAQDAVALRRWDDEAKVAGLVVPGLDHYRGLLQACLRNEAAHAKPL